MDKKIIGENGEVQEIPLLKKALHLFFWYLIGRYGGWVLIRDKLKERHTPFRFTFNNIIYNNF